MDFAVRKARDAFEDGRWSRQHPSARKDVLIRLAKLLTRNAHELAVMESLDSGKTILDCQTIDIPETISTINWHAEAIDKIYDQVSPASDDHISMIVREPIGVVGLVLPWNFPLLMLAWKIGPALAAGCSVVVKPAMETALTSLRVAELAMEAGIPAGVLNILPGGGADAGEPIGRHMDIDMVSFTGSTATGKRFLGYAADSNAKEVVLEMGGKNPAIVMDDAENLDRVAQHLVNGAFWNMGENCSASSRLIVHKDVKAELLERIGHHASQWNLGDPLDPETRLGALVSKTHFDKCSYLDKADNVLIGGGAKDGFVEATVIEVADNDSLLTRDQIFGPVISVIEISGFDEAIAIANGLRITAFVHQFLQQMRSVPSAEPCSIRAEPAVTVNSYGEGDITTPFGGFKQSGFGGRDNGIHAHDPATPS